MKYCHFAFDDHSEHCSYHINSHQDDSVFPYYVPSMGMDAQGPRYFTDRCGFEMLFVCLTLEGSGAVMAGEESHILLPGDLMVLDGFKPHRYESRSELWQFLWIHVKGYGAREFFNRMAPSGLLYRRMRNTAPIHELYEALVPLVESPTPENNLKASEQLGGFLHRLAYYTVVKEEPALPDALGRTLTYIREHLEEDLTVDGLAARENYSTSYFTHLFSDRMGISPYRYVLRQRLQSAAAMLLFTERRVEDIARQYRFTDAGQFIGHFRRYFGVTPLQYRKAARAEQQRGE